MAECRFCRQNLCKGVLAVGSATFGANDQHEVQLCEMHLDRCRSWKKLIKENAERVRQAPYKEER